MGRHKGGKNKIHTKEEKLKYVKMMMKSANAIGGISFQRS